MEPLPYQLVSTVQDLFDLYLQFNPSGTYHNRLFHDRGETEFRLPAELKVKLETLDGYIRGASCLLANDLGTPAFPLLIAAWKMIREIARQSVTPKTREPDYYRYISYELSHPRALNSTEAYRLFGELLAVLLDVLCNRGLDDDKSLRTEITRLRGQLNYSGESSTGSSDTGS